MASATRPLALSLNLPALTVPKRRTKHRLYRSSMSTAIGRCSSAVFRPPWPRRRRPSDSSSSAYITGPPSDPIVADDYPKVDVSRSDGESIQSPPKAISWGLLSSLLLQHKFRLAVSVVALAGCTSCTLAMPFYSGRFFEVLIGPTAEPLWNVLGKVGVLYVLEPVFTIIFVVNLNTIWEKVMSNLRAQMFRRVLIQKVEFFDKYKSSAKDDNASPWMVLQLNVHVKLKTFIWVLPVGELTALITSDLGSLKDIVSENISRDRGFRALSEASYSTLSESCWNNMHPV